MIDPRLLGFVAPNIPPPPPTMEAAINLFETIGAISDRVAVFENDSRAALDKWALTEAARWGVVPGQVWWRESRHGRGVRSLARFEVQNVRAARYRWASADAVLEINVHVHPLRKDGQLMARPAVAGGLSLQRNGYRWALAEPGVEGVPPGEDAFAEWSPRDA